MFDWYEIYKDGWVKCPYEEWQKYKGLKRKCGFTGYIVYR